MPLSNIYWLLSQIFALCTLHFLSRVFRLSSNYTQTVGLHTLYRSPDYTTCILNIVPQTQICHTAILSRSLQLPCKVLGADCSSFRLRQVYDCILQRRSQPLIFEINRSSRILHAISPVTVIFSISLYPAKRRGARFSNQSPPSGDIALVNTMTLSREDPLGS